MKAVVQDAKPAKKEKPAPKYLPAAFRPFHPDQQPEEIKWIIGTEFMRGDYRGIARTCYIDGSDLWVWMRFEHSSCYVHIDELEPVDSE